MQCRSTPSDGGCVHKGTPRVEKPLCRKVKHVYTCQLDWPLCKLEKKKVTVCGIIIPLCSYVYSCKVTILNLKGELRRKLTFGLPKHWYLPSKPFSEICFDDNQMLRVLSLKMV